MATELGMTMPGLKLSLLNETLKLRDFRKLIKILDVPVTTFFGGNYIGNSNIKENQKMNSSENDILKETIKILKSQLEDKEIIIQLLQNKK
ncbi:MAG: hypothetical protein WBP45_12560 [Daejeonella sp.]